MSAERDAQVRLAAEALLDVFLSLADGKDDDEVVFIDGFMREMAELMHADASFPEIEPMPAGEYRSRWRRAKARIANEDAASVSLPRAGEHE